MTKRTLLLLCGAGLFASLVCGQQLTPEQTRQIDAAIPKKAPAKPRKARRLLVTNLAKNGDRIIQGHPSIPAGNYAIEQMGKRTSAYEAVFSNDIEMFRPDKISQFDAICSNNTQGVLFDDPELKKSLLGFIAAGHGFVGIHAAIATFVQYPVYDQWTPFGRMLGGTESGGHPWGPTEKLTVKVDDPKSPLNAAFHGKGFDLIDEVNQLQEPSPRERLHVLLSVDMDKTPPPPHAPLKVRALDKDFPLSWIRNEEKGRVFYFGLAHNPPAFWNAPLLEHILAGIQYALGDLKADATPSANPASRKK
jgi:type 1 glutamine amidotransferase